MVFGESRQNLRRYHSRSSERKNDDVTKEPIGVVANVAASRRRDGSLGIRS
jgi:hypothetical protein